MKHGIKAFLRAVNQPTELHYNRRRRCVVSGTKLSKNARFCKVYGTQVEFSPIQTIMTQAHEKRISFFCQLDNEKHPATHSAYQCEQCARHVCDSCYRDMIMVGLSDCSYCCGKLIQIQ